MVGWESELHRFHISARAFPHSVYSGGHPRSTASFCNVDSAFCSPCILTRFFDNTRIAQSPSRCTDCAGQEISLHRWNREKQIRRFSFLSFLFFSPIFDRMRLKRESVRFASVRFEGSIPFKSTKTKAPHSGCFSFCLKGIESVSHTPGACASASANTVGYP